MHFKRDDVPKVAQALLAYAEGLSREKAVVFCLTGDLGAGKTTLVQALAHTLGVSYLVPSPTFVIMRSYETTSARFPKLIHIDAYRIENEAELPPLKFDEAFKESDALICIEWPERLFGRLPQDVVTIALSPAGEEERDMALVGPDGNPLQIAI